MMTEGIDVVFSLGKDKAETWEAVAAIQIMQATGVKVGVCSTDPIVGYLCHLAGFRVLDPVKCPPTVTFSLDEAFRLVDTATSDMTYQAVLARTSGVALAQPIGPAKFPRIVPLPWKHNNGNSGGHIVLCPFTLPKLQAIPMNAWKAIARYLRTYGVPVYLVSDAGQRTDGLNFTEGCMLSDVSVNAKLDILATAQLVVGMPNAWTWLASSWQRPLAIYYPNDVPAMRWYGFYNSALHGRVEYLPHQIQIPLLLAGLRQLMTDMQQRENLTLVTCQ